MKKKFKVSKHAKDKLKTLTGFDMEDSDARNMLVAMYHSSSIFGGGQIHNNELRLSTCRRTQTEMVLACENQEDGVIIKTILPLEHAIANVQMRMQHGIR